MTHFIDQFSDKFGLDRAETNSIMSRLNSECPMSAGDNYSGSGNNGLDYIELFLAIALNAKIRDLTDDPRYKKLKLLINNNSKRAVDLGNRWMDGQVSFEEMLAVI